MASSPLDSCAKSSNAPEEDSFTLLQGMNVPKSQRTICNAVLNSIDRFVNIHPKVRRILWIRIVTPKPTSRPGLCQARRLTLPSQSLPCLAARRTIRLQVGGGRLPLTKAQPEKTREIA